MNGGCEVLTITCLIKKPIIVNIFLVTVVKKESIESVFS